MVDIGIIGGTGYAGAECTRILASHPGFNITCIVSKSFEGKKISQVYPNLSGVCDIECEALDIDVISKKAGCFIAALPHAASQKVVYELVSSGKKVVDLSADFRYSSPGLYEKTYGLKHDYPGLLAQAAYGLPELNRQQIAGALVTANPGCYPTCSILALAPLLKNNMIETDSININAVSGISGAGRKADLAYQFCECDENFTPYKVTGHRHTTEIEEQLSIISNSDIKVGFTPHLAPFKRGMLATIYTKASVEISKDMLWELFDDFYKDEFFIRVIPEGTLPSVKAVAGSNFADLAPVYDGRLGRIIVMSAIDNLGKGAASQAVQNLNIMYGFDEKTGLSGAGPYI
jgi:N-acetyl-gamma-glutamyl-phosphate reductase